MAKTKIKQLMVDRGISGKDVSKGTGLNKTHVSMIVGGYQNITMSTLKKLCKFFKVGPNDVVDWERWLT